MSKLELAEKVLSGLVASIDVAMALGINVAKAVELSQKAKQENRDWTDAEVQAVLDDAQKSIDKL